MVFHWSLSDRNLLKSPGLLSVFILAILNNVVVWMVSTPPPTSKSSRPFNNPLVTVPNVSITICIIVTYMFHSFFNSLSFFSLLVSFTNHCQLVVVHRNLSDNKTPQIYRCFLNILTSLNNAFIWMVTNLPPISNSSLPFPSLWKPF